MWTRRTVLRALGASAWAPLLGPWLQACGSTRALAPAPGAPITQRPLDEIRSEVRALVADLSQRFPDATALVTVRRMGAALVDAAGTSMGHQQTGGLVLALSLPGGGRRALEEATTDLSREGMARLAEALRNRAAAGYQAARPPMPLGRPRDHATPMAQDPRTLPAAAWLEHTGRLYERGRLVGGSRMVYRAAYLVVDDRDVLFIGQGRDLAQRVARTRGGMLLVAQSGAAGGTVATVAERSGTMGLEALQVTDSELEAAAEQALGVLAPVAPPSGELAVVLDPSVTARIAAECLGPALDGLRWASGESPAPAFEGQRIGSPAVTLIDDPTAAGGFGSYFFDDEGTPARPLTLIEAGRLRGPLVCRRSAVALGRDATGHGRRAGLLEAAMPAASNLVFTGPGGATSDLPGSRATLVQQVQDRGLLIEGGLSASLDPASFVLSVRAARAHEIVKGALTGVLYGAVTVRGYVPAVLGAVAAVAGPVVARAWPTARVPMAGAGPFMLTRAQILGGGSPGGWP